MRSLSQAWMRVDETIREELPAAQRMIERKIAE